MTDHSCEICALPACPCVVPSDERCREPVCDDLAALAARPVQPGHFANAVRLGGLWFDRRDVVWHWRHLRRLLDLD